MEADVRFGFDHGKGTFSEHECHDSACGTLTWITFPHSSVCCGRYAMVILIDNTNTVFPCSGLCIACVPPMPLYRSRLM
jgi:hypothetical protein